MLSHAAVVETAPVTSKVAAECYVQGCGVGAELPQNCFGAGAGAIDKIKLASRRCWSIFFCIS